MLPLLLLLLGGGTAVAIAKRTPVGGPAKMTPVRESSPVLTPPLDRMTILPYTGPVSSEPINPAGRVSIMPFPNPGINPGARPPVQSGGHPSVHWTTSNGDVVVLGSQQPGIENSYKAQYEQFDDRGRPKMPLPALAAVPDLKVPPGRAVKVSPVPVPRRDVVYLGGSPGFDESRPISARM